MRGSGGPRAGSEKSSRPTISKSESASERRKKKKAPVSTQAWGSAEFRWGGHLEEKT